MPSHQESGRTPSTWPLRTRRDLTEPTNDNAANDALRVSDQGLHGSTENMGSNIISGARDGQNSTEQHDPNDETSSTPPSPWSSMLSEPAQNHSEQTQEWDGVHSTTNGEHQQNGSTMEETCGDESTGSVTPTQAEGDPEKETEQDNEDYTAHPATEGDSDGPTTPADRRSPITPGSSSLWDAPDVPNEDLELMGFPHKDRKKD